MSIYTAIATSSGRDARAVSSDGRLDVKLALQKELGGDGEGTNPEQLFAAGYAACFASALRLVAGSKQIDVSDAAVTAEVGLSPNGKGGFQLDATLRVELPDGIAPEVARELVEATHQVCPYSNATRGNIPVELVIE
ncbi:Organic hydroperoxide resistance protein [[Actinomadura] parvosata subsp. kistnae]|uniref:Ohr subfamily peroxiredoxin n=2 Tax=Nonomuraea TaxID=83681 RepID=A0A1V0AGQ3_9ACTN|nr:MULTISPECIES: organic hydroperoxide resistance protein [unclassified Nonomuraea]AQZ69411.1 Ohr subfamily peroxiredoxin [Nonomuraea sp. ATCC 55076]NJP90464.1 organic hydroperoxide resistance protein [Nonomuraea sp. FMUSA5-5]SPL91945.1 Organic hydroperoxide resistance protein [Actinomadura parvosata subsp. kistnae]